MIYILGTEEHTAQWLDDKALSRQIKDISQVLCNAHFTEFMIMPCYACELDDPDEYCTCTSFRPPLEIKNQDNEWSQWAHKCLANYRYLVNLGLICIREHFIRFIDGDKCFTYSGDKNKVIFNVKYGNVISWARNYEPELASASPPRLTCNACTPDGACYAHAGIPAPYPLVIPDKYLELIDISMPLPECYIAYYAMVLRNQRQQRLKCKECGGFGTDNPGACSDPGCCGYTSDCGPCNGTGYITKPEPTWTRRKVPVWAKPAKPPPLPMAK